MLSSPFDRADPSAAYASDVSWRKSPTLRWMQHAYVAH
jgi:hypothetical protein